MRRTATILLLLLLLGCQDEPQLYDRCDDEDVFCADGLRCGIGYCTKSCEADSECERDGVMTECFRGEESPDSPGECAAICTAEDMTCPETLVCSVLSGICVPED